jgi:cytochrome c553
MNMRQRPVRRRQSPPSRTRPRGTRCSAQRTANSQSCASCHNADGNSAIAANPKLAQQHPEYILKQLQDFKSGKRKNAIMSRWPRTLSEQDMRDIAWFVGSKKVKPGFSKDKDTIAMGEKIYRGGIGERQVPACAGCHSPNGAGLPAQYPRLGGQNAEYTVAQLTAFPRQRAPEQHPHDRRGRQAQRP